jgi:hypothetical protein
MLTQFWSESLEARDDVGDGIGWRILLKWMSKSGEMAWI